MPLMSSEECQIVSLAQNTMLIALFFPLTMTRIEFPIKHSQGRMITQPSLKLLQRWGAYLFVKQPITPPTRLESSSPY